jgi:acetyltransferase-like isoleucine patch superfamily enzyme
MMAVPHRRLRALHAHLHRAVGAGAGAASDSDDGLHQCFASIGEGTVVEPGADVGFKYHRDAGPAKLGKGGIIRRGTVIYGDTDLGDYFQTGHNAIIRARVRCGDYCTVLNNACIEGLVRMGSGCRLMSNCYLPTRSWLGDNVFFGPGVTVTNSRYPGRLPDLPSARGVTVEDDVMVGGGVTLLAGVRIGAGSFVAAGATVVASVPPNSFVRGFGEVEPLPAHFDVASDPELNRSRLDLWHPAAESCAIDWPDDWPERWERAEPVDAGAVVDGANSRPEVYNQVMGWVRGCFLRCGSPAERARMREACTERVAVLATATAGRGGLGGVDWVREPLPPLG